jgi:hypothetical protein
MVMEVMEAVCTVTAVGVLVTTDGEEKSKSCHGGRWGHSCLMISLSQ